MISYSQNFEDVVLSRALTAVSNGFYIDVGAWDPHEHSVTLTFYERGWHGINVEPHPKYLEKLSNQRTRDINLGAAIGNRRGKKKLYAFDETGLSTFNRKIADGHVKSGRKYRLIDVDVITLNDLFDQYNLKEVHFLKVDCEGYEREVLDGLNLKKHRPWIIIVEATIPTKPKLSDNSWESSLTSNGYQYAYFDGLNKFYVAAEHSELQKTLSVPPNVFDEIILDREVARQTTIAHLEGQLQIAKSDFNASQDSLLRAQNDLDASRDALRRTQNDLDASRDALLRTQNYLDASRDTLLSLLRTQNDLDADEISALKHDIKVFEQSFRAARIQDNSDDIHRIGQSLDALQKMQGDIAQRAEAILLTFALASRHKKNAEAFDDHAGGDRAKRETG